MYFFLFVFRFLLKIKLLDPDMEAIVYLDNASYHKKRVNSPPTQASTVPELISWLIGEDGTGGHLRKHPNPRIRLQIYQLQERLQEIKQSKEEATKTKRLSAPKMSKKDLLEVVNQIAQAHPKEYLWSEIQVIAETYNMKVQYLSPYSPEYNPIELVWASVKGEVAREYQIGKNLNVSEKVFEKMTEIATSDFWIKVFRKVQKNEDKQFEEEPEVEREYFSDLDSEDDSVSEDCEEDDE